MVQIPGAPVKKRGKYIQWDLARHAALRREAEDPQNVYQGGRNDGKPNWPKIASILKADAAFEDEDKMCVSVSVFYTNTHTHTHATRSHE